MRAAAALLAVMVLSACSAGADGDTAPTAPAPSADSQAIACGLLDSQQREDLTGRKVDTVTDPSRSARSTPVRGLVPYRI